MMTQVVLKPNQEVEDIMLIVLSEALKLKVFVWMLDDTDRGNTGLLCVSTSAVVDTNKPKTKFQKNEKDLAEITLCVAPGSVDTISKANGIHLLLRPGQYCILCRDEVPCSYYLLRPRLIRYIFCRVLLNGASSIHPLVKVAS